MYTFPQQDDKCNGTRFNSNSSNLNKRMAHKALAQTHTQTLLSLSTAVHKKSEQANNEYWHAALFFSSHKQLPVFSMFDIIVVAVAPFVAIKKKCYLPS